ncbi:laminin subunit alpha-1-like isoform X2 [Arvicola amphibius]|uniref:laminin subunit alpha-1-like isoform X2 n=1 Tax=Arvicola amphibius TaxID=1047088 RepID=UPI0018E31F2A|nr:laminin subunit alpha-1-like isoform X2 [Arvicola amphibius]
MCAPSHYGKVIGLLGDCTPCTCPHRPPFSFSPTCVLEGDGGFRCDACIPGYEGQGVLHFLSKRDDGLWAELARVFLVDADCPVYTYCPRFSRCFTGYHDNPHAAVGSCQKCDYNPQGSVHSDCDHTSGQCVCKPGATVLHCDECWPRHIMAESDCMSCDDECVGAVLNDLDTVGDAVLSLNLTGVSSAPYGILSSLENTTKYSRN